MVDGIEMDTAPFAGELPAFGAAPDDEEAGTLPDATRPETDEVRAAAAGEAPAAPATPPPTTSRAGDSKRLVRGTIWDGRYRVERTLGEGGMGSVLLAADLAKNEQLIALKVLRPKFREIATPNFLREYSIQRLLRHQSIPRALDVGFDLHHGKEVPYFTMPFVKGESLVTIIEDEPPLASAWRWTIEILEALDTLHRAGYLHRDVKPGNILVDRSAKDGPEARLIDFGITTTLTSQPEHYFTGTPAYCSPENIEGAPHDVRSDLYALGLVLYELIEYEPPWTTTELDETLFVRRTEVAPRVKNPACPEGIVQLVAELLDADAERRPPSAAAVIERMRAALNISAPLGSAAAFALRLAGVTVPSPSYVRALECQGEIVLLHVPEGHDGAELLGEIGDQRAMSGVRVVRVRLEGRAGPPLHELEGALDVFRRLRAEDGQADLYRGLAGAAMMLTRTHRPTMLVIDGLERADQAILTVLRHAFLGAKNAHLKVVATVCDGAVANPVGKVDEAAHAAFVTLVGESFVTHLSLEDLTRAETHAYVHAALGEDVPDDATVDAIYDRSAGRPSLVRQELVAAFRDGTLERRADGYRWNGAEVSPEHTPEVPEAGPDTLARARLPLLHVPFPVAAVVRYLGGEANYQRLLATGAIKASETAAVAADGVASAQSFAALPIAEQQALHRLMAEALATLPAYLEPHVQAADQLLLAGRPAAAAPWFARMARDDYRDREDARAESKLAKAMALVRADTGQDTELRDWKLEVLATSLDQARLADDGGRVIMAAEALLLAAIGARELAAIEHALMARIDEALEVWDVLAATETIAALFVWQKRCQAIEARGARALLDALELALQGDDRGVVQRIGEGLGELEAAAEDTLLAAWTRRKLLSLRAEVAVRGGHEQVALRALAALEEDIAQHDLSPLRPSPWAERKLAVHKAVWLRRSGDLIGACAVLEANSAQEASAAAGQPATGRRAAIELAIAECDLALGRCESANAHAQKSLDAARHENNEPIAFAATAVLAEVAARRGDAGFQVERMKRLIAGTPLQILPHLVIEVKLRWLAIRLLAGEGETLIEAALSVTRDALHHRDAGAVARAALVAALAELRARQPEAALRHAEWVRTIDRQQPIGGPPRHAIEWLLASTYYQLKWFRSASNLSGRALESLRAVAQCHVGSDDREQWLRAGDSVLVGMQR